VLRGSNRPGSGSGVISASCVIFLGPKRGLGVLWAARAAAGAGLLDDARRRAHVHAVLGTRVVANGRVRMRSAQAR
jgi:hypothetical protein